MCRRRTHARALLARPRRLFESVAPLLPDLVGRLSADIAPFCATEGGLRFGAPDVGEPGGGPWRNYFVGLVGAVAADEDDVLWPNQVGGAVLVGLCCVQWLWPQLCCPPAGRPACLPARLPSPSAPALQRPHPPTPTPRVAAPGAGAAPRPRAVQCAQRC